MKRAMGSLRLLLVAVFSFSCGEQKPGDFSGEWPVPFVLPYDDHQSGITHFGELYGAVQSQPLPRVGLDGNGHFSAAGKRIRFWGVNITASSCFPNHDQAERIAARLSKFGVNIVRFHHMESAWGKESLLDYTAGNSRNIDQDNLDKLDYFVAQLKKHGIYSNINLQTARAFKAGDGVAPQLLELPWKAQHVYSTVSPQFLALEQEHARNLLKHKNPYTQLTYAEDPAIAFVEINNENSILQQYFDGNVDSWPDELTQRLKQKWNAWLHEKYLSHEAMQAGWKAINEPLGDNLLSNTYELNGNKNWSVENFGGAQAVATSNRQNRSISIQVAERGDAAWNVQLHHPLPGFNKGEVYTLSFQARATQHDAMIVAVMQNYEPWQGYHQFKIPLGSDWQEYSYTFVTNRSDAGARLNFGNLGSVVGSVDLRNVEFRAGGAVGSLAASERLQSGGVLPNVSTRAYTAARNEDWMAFLYDLDSTYWATMKNYLEDTLQVQALTYGTIASLSPAANQQQFGFIDSHIYWAHPYFPNQQWDKNDWLVENESMVNTMHGNTLDNLARQRVAGLPFVVSEYQHSMPNSFMAESALMVAAYGGLQDWDGIYFFSYEVGDDGWSAGFFNDFMQTNNHPSAMANLGIASNLFRRGDVNRARSAQYLPFGKEQQIHASATQGRVWSVAPVSFPEAMKGFAFAHRTGFSVSGKHAASLEKLTRTDRVESDTGELLWDISQPGKGVLTINTELTKGLLGYVEHEQFSLGGLAVHFGGLQLGWATWMVTAQQGSLEHLQDGANLLVVATGRTENTDMTWKTPERQSVGKNWGKSPSVIEVVPFQLRLPAQKNRVQAWALDETGNRREALEVLDYSGGSVVMATGRHKTLWYEVIVKP